MIELCQYLSRLYLIAHLYIYYGNLSAGFETKGCLRICAQGSLPAGGYDQIPTLGNRGLSR